MERIKNMTEEQVQKALFVGLAFFALIFLLPNYMWVYHVRANQVQEIFLVILTIYFLVLFGIEYRNKRIPINNVSLLSLLVMAVVSLISSLWNGDLTNSIYGDEFQGEGLITLITYFALFFAAAHLKKKEYRYWLLMFVVLNLGFVALYGILQFFQVPYVVRNVIKAAIFPSRNQNFYAAFPVLLLGIVFGKLLYDNREKMKRGKKVLWHLLVLLGYGAAISSVSLIAYLGIIMQFVIMIFLEFFRKQKRFKLILLFILEFILVFMVFDWCSGGQAKEEVNSLPAQIQQEGSVFGDAVGSGRMKIWKETMKIIRENWAFGCGIETFKVNIGTEEAPEYNRRAHNEYLHIWAEQGTFAVISYIVFLFSLFIPGLLQFIKTRDYESDIVSKAAMFAFFGYIAQAFANVRMIQVAPYFWLCCGLLYVRKRQDKKNEKESDETRC